MTSFALLLLHAVVFEALLVWVQRLQVCCMMLGRMTIAAGVGLPGLSNASHCVGDSFPNTAFCISAVLGSFQVQKQKYWNTLGKAMQL